MSAQDASGAAPAVRFVPVLFTQGVDIRQSMANRSGAKEGSGARYQMSLNRK